MRATRQSPRQFRRPGKLGSPELSVGESSRPVSLTLRWVEVLQDR
jgi:hypothetical protein